MRLDPILSMRDIYINFNLNPLTNSLEATEAPSLKYPPIEHLSNDREDCSNQHKNSGKLCNEMGHSIVNLMEGQCKLRQQHDQNFPMGGKPL